MDPSRRGIPVREEEAGLLRIEKPSHRIVPNGRVRTRNPWRSLRRHSKSMRSIEAEKVFFDDAETNASACKEDMVPAGLRWNHGHLLDVSRIARNVDVFFGGPEEGTRGGATVHVT